MLDKLGIDSVVSILSYSAVPHFFLLEFSERVGCIMFGLLVLCLVYCWVRGALFCERAGEGVFGALLGIMMGHW